MLVKETLPPLREDHHGVIPYAGPNLALYQIEQELTQLLYARDQAIEECAPPEELEAIDKTIAEYFAREVKKVDGICHALQVFSDAEDMARAEAKRLTERADAHRAHFDRIKAATLKAMQDHSVRVLETPTNKLRVQANGGKEPLEVDSDTLTPDDFRVYNIRFTSGEEKELREHLQSLPFFSGVLQAIADRLESANGEPDNEAIRAALKQQMPCPGCAGSGKSESIGDDSRPCLRCEGRGIVSKTIPGAKLLPRGMHLRVE